MAAFLILVCLINLSFCEIAMAYFSTTTKWTPNRTFSMDELCEKSNQPVIKLGKTGIKSSGYLQMSRSNLSSEKTFNCSVVIKAPAGYGVVVAFRWISTGSRIDNFCSTFVKVFDGETNEDLSNPICGVEFYEPLEKRYVYRSNVDSSSIYIRFVHITTDNSENGNVGFQLTFTGFTYGELEDCSPTSQFLCRNKRCIARYLLCDEHNNCGDLSDELENGICVTHSVNYLTTAGYVGILFAVLILILVLLFILVPRSPSASWVRPNQPFPGRIFTSSRRLQHSESPVGIATVSVSVPFSVQADFLPQQFNGMREPPPSYNNVAFVNEPNYGREATTQNAVRDSNTVQNIDSPPPYETVERPRYLTRRSRSQ